MLAWIQAFTVRLQLNLRASKSAIAKAAARKCRKTDCLPRRGIDVFRWCERGFVPARGERCGSAFAKRLRRDRLRRAVARLLRRSSPEGRAKSGGERGIRTPGNRFRFSGFQDHRHRPLGHLSVLGRLSHIQSAGRAVPHIFEDGVRFREGIAVHVLRKRRPRIHIEDRAQTSSTRHPSLDGALSAATGRA